MNPTRTSRRTFLAASTMGLAGTIGGRTVHGGTTGGRARSTILFFLCGGASHVDTWDMKPDAPAEYRGPFRPIATSAPGVTLCEHLPLLARQAHHLTLVNSIGGTVNTNDHHAGYYHQLTGHVPDASFRTLGNNRTPFRDDWPYMGTVVGSRRPAHPTLTNAISLPHKPSRLPYTRPGQFAGRLGVEHDPLYVLGSFEKPLEFRAPSLELGADLAGSRINDRRNLLDAFDSARRVFDETADTARWSRQRERAFDLLTSSSTARAFDLSDEREDVHRRYGEGINGTSLLLARRLVEVGVPFVTVFWMGDPGTKDKCKSGGGWDTHGDNFNCLRRDLLPAFDRGFSALIADLHDRGLLESTLLLVTSEMGRKPRIGDPRSGGVSGAGRDHWTHCLTDLLAGGGIKGGTTYGSSDRFAEYPADRPLTPADIVHTVYHAMGIDDLEAVDSRGRPYRLLDRGTAIHDLF